MSDPLPGAATPLTVCIAENRRSCEPALRILVASLARHCPGMRVMLFCPDASPAFAHWVATYDHCVLNPCALDGEWTKYDIKPLALLSVLGTGAREVVWIDSDILITRDVRPIFAALVPDVVAVTEEALGAGYADPDALRARLWGFPVGRVMPFTANTGVLRVTPAHRDLLHAWHDLMRTDTYRAAQALPWHERPPHLAGDQEVFTALLASDRFAALPIRFLRRGADIVQYFGSAGYTVAERFRHLRRGMPPFVHSQGFRPWWSPAPPPGGLAARFNHLYATLSPYTVLARDYAGVLEDARWLDPPTPAARLFRTRSAPLTGLPLAIVADAVRVAKSAIRRKIRA